MRGFDKAASSKIINTNSQSKYSGCAIINNGPVPFPTESIDSSLSLRRESAPCLASALRSLKKESCDQGKQNEPAPILIKDLSDITPRSECKRRLSNDLLAVLESVLKRSKIGAQPPALEPGNSSSADSMSDAKKKYEMAFTGLEELMASLKREYQLKF